MAKYAKKRRPKYWKEPKYKYHILYKMTNKITGHFYFGAHSTNDLRDGYAGSGVLITKAVDFHGLSNFRKEIVKYCDSRQHLYREERKLITKDVVQNPNSYNLITGGKRKSKNTYRISRSLKNCKELL